MSMENVNVLEIKELCADVVAQKIANVQSTERIEGAVKSTFFGNKTYYVKLESSLVDFSTKIKVFVEGICVFEEVNLDNEAVDEEALLSFVWLSFSTSMLRMLFDRVIGLNEFCEDDEEHDIKDDVNWATLLFELCSIMRENKLDKELVVQMENKAYDCLAEIIMKKN